MFVINLLTNELFSYIIIIANERFKDSASPEIYEKQVVTVHTGDTLWDIAADWSGKEEDIREVILRIQKENKLTGSDLSVGQRLVIPVRKTVADVIAEQNERNAGRAQLAAK